MTFVDEPHYVYQHLDDDGSVLYVGCTVDLKRRSIAHQSESPWWPRVAEVATVAGPLPKDAARSLEVEMIRELDPPHNVTYTTRDYRKPIAREGADRQYVTLKEAAVLVPCCTRTLRRHIKAGDLATYTFGYSPLVYVDAAELPPRRRAQVKSATA